MHLFTSRIASFPLALRRGRTFIIVASHPELNVSLSTVYRHFSKGYYSASKIHLPRAVKFKPRKKKRADVVPSGIKKERTYADFLAHMEREGLSAHTQLDTVIGVSGGKVILTVHFTAFNFIARDAYGQRWRVLRCFRL